MFIEDNLISWSFKCQPMVPFSNVEGEYRFVANGVTEVSCLQQALQELYNPLTSSTLICRDNINVVYLSINLEQHQHMKHVEIDFHFIRKCVAIADVCALHVPTSSWFANIFIKGLPFSMFFEFWFNLNICCG